MTEVALCAAEAATVAPAEYRLGAAAVLNARFDRLHGLIPDTLLAVDAPSLPLMA